MNERIKELAVAAAPANSNIPHSEWNIPKEFIEKLAELIVRECASMARVYCSDEFDFTGDLKLDEFMLKHFGVES